MCILTTVVETWNSKGKLEKFTDMGTKQHTSEQPMDREEKGTRNDLETNENGNAVYQN